MVLQFPKDVEDLKRLVDDLALIKEDHWWMVLMLFSLAYLFKQTFSIPGSAILVNIHSFIYPSICSSGPISIHPSIV